MMEAEHIQKNQIQIAKNARINHQKVSRGVRAVQAIHHHKGYCLTFQKKKSIRNRENG